jgi:hypothetical protein
MWTICEEEAAQCAKLVAWLLMQWSHMKIHDCPLMVIYVNCSPVPFFVTALKISNSHHMLLMLSFHFTKSRLMLEKCSGVSHNSVSKDLVCFCSCIRWSMFPIPCCTTAWLLCCWASALSNTNHHPSTQICYPTPKIRPTMTCPLQLISLGLVGLSWKEVSDAHE